MCILIMCANRAGRDACSPGPEFRELERRRPGRAAPSVRLPVVFNDARFRVTMSPASAGPRRKRIASSGAADSLRPFDKATVDHETVDLCTQDEYRVGASASASGRPTGQNRCTQVAENRRVHEATTRQRGCP